MLLAFIGDARPRPLLLGLLCFAVFFRLSFGAAYAHQASVSASGAGIAIPNLTHGQLKVMADYRNAIVEIAEDQVRPDFVTRNLLNFVNVQYAYCLWGLVPGSLMNEESPFNACTHAYLAGSKALLAHLESVADDRDAAQALASRINLAMLQDDEALQICSHSKDVLYSGDVIVPDWPWYLHPLFGLSLFLTIGMLPLLRRKTFDTSIVGS